MERYAEFRPTGFDSAGLGLDDRQDWLVMDVTKNRDSGPRALSNWDATIKSLEEGACDEDYEEHSFGHWACGWFEIIIVRPGTKAEEIAEEIEGALSCYPILDDEDCSNREWEEHSSYVSETVERIAWENDGEVHDDVDYASLADSLQWYYNGRTPSTDDIFDALCERGWFIPDGDSA